MSLYKALFFVGIVATIIGLLSPPMALGAGILCGMLFGAFSEHPFERQSRDWSKILLQWSVVALGFGMKIGEVLKEGRASFGYTAIGISAAIGIGLSLGYVLKVRPKAAFLITAGTAICGGSAIAAIAPITGPDDEELAMSLGTVFTLNSAALLLFPALGHAMHLTQTQFGLWSALAIHDTSSVVGAAAKFGAQALAVATVVKLTRALWIIPVALATAMIHKSKAKVRLPWFIPLFCVAAFAGSALPGWSPLFARLSGAGHIGLAVTLFLIGTGISVKTVRQAGARVMLQGILLWVVVAGASLYAIHAGWIAL